MSLDHINLARIDYARLAFASKGGRDADVAKRRPTYEVIRTELVLGNPPLQRKTLVDLGAQRLRER